MIGAVADFVHAEQLEAVKPAGGQLLSDDPLEDVAEGQPADPHQLGDLRLAHLLRQPRREILEIAGVPRARPRPRHRLVHLAAAGAIQPSEPALITHRKPPRSRCRHGFVRCSLIFRPRAPQPEQAGFFAFSTTVTITARSPNSTSLTHAPGSPSIRFNAVLTRTSPSFVDR